MWQYCLYTNILNIVNFCTVVLIVHFAIPNKLNTYDEIWLNGYSLNTFGSKSAYKHHGLKSTLTSMANGSYLVHANILFRHGTRSPSINFSKKIIQFERMLKQIDKFKNASFSNNSASFDEKKLLPSGYAELKLLGKRFKRYLPNLFHKSTVSQIYVSPTERTRQSASAFATSFFDDWQAVKYIEDSDNLRFFDLCSAYKRTVKNNETVLHEYYKFMHGPEMKTVLEEVVADNNLQIFNLTIKNLIHLHTIASHEISVLKNGEPVPAWIQIFRPKHLYTLEYLHDLKHYWLKANPVQISYEQVCPLWGTIMDQLLMSAEHDLDPNKHGKEPPRGIYWFAHAETLIPLVIKLGLFNESAINGGQHLNSKGFLSRIERLALQPPVSNMFRTSHISPFAANIAFLLYRNPTVSKPTLDDYFLEVLLNEVVVDIIPTIPRSQLSLPVLLARFSTCRSKNYDQKKVCAVPYSAYAHSEF